MHIVTHYPITVNPQQRQTAALVYMQGPTLANQSVARHRVARILAQIRTEARDQTGENGFSVGLTLHQLGLSVVQFVLVH